MTIALTLFAFITYFVGEGFGYRRAKFDFEVEEKRKELNRKASDRYMTYEQINRAIEREAAKWR